MNSNQRIPVTVLTGFLGSGKTTLLNRILTENHGKKIAVIENEFGEVGVDNELVIGADEEIFEMNNGCICCTVRGDLIRILGNLMKRKDRLDMILVETTGLADPGPVAQTFFVDDEMQAQYQIDSIVTLVDAGHVLLHIDTSDECKQQIAFADVIIINKIDLVSEEELATLEKRFRSMNALAKIYHTQNAALDLSHVLNVGAFEIDQKVEMNPEFLKEEVPFEWGGIYNLAFGPYALTLNEGPDPSMDIAFVKLGNNSTDALESAKRKAIMLFSEEPQVLSHSASITVSSALYQFSISRPVNEFVVQPLEAGYFAVFTQHHPDEFKMRLKDGSEAIYAIESQEYEHSHSHDNEISSVGIETEAPVNPNKFQTWINFLLQTKGTDIFRSKGILNVEGRDDRLVFQGVHMLLDLASDRDWKPAEIRRNQLVFIGRNLNRTDLQKGFEACLTEAEVKYA